MSVKICPIADRKEEALELGGDFLRIRAQIVQVYQKNDP
jgi:hypothetical protein